MGCNKSKKKSNNNELPGFAYIHVGTFLSVRDCLRLSCVSRGAHRALNGKESNLLWRHLLQDLFGREAVVQLTATGYVNWRNEFSSLLDEIPLICGPQTSAQKQWIEKYCFELEFTTEFYLFRFRSGNQALNQTQANDEKREEEKKLVKDAGLPKPKPKPNSAAYWQHVLCVFMSELFWFRTPWWQGDDVRPLSHHVRLHYYGGKPYCRNHVDISMGVFSWYVLCGRVGELPHFVHARCDNAACAHHSQPDGSHSDSFTVAPVFDSLELARKRYRHRKPVQGEEDEEEEEEKLSTIRPLACRARGILPLKVLASGAAMWCGERYSPEEAFMPKPVEVAPKVPRFVGEDMALPQEILDDMVYDKGLVGIRKPSDNDFVEKSRLDFECSVFGHCLQGWNEFMVEFSPSVSTSFFDAGVVWELDESIFTVYNPSTGGICVCHQPATEF